MNSLIKIILVIASAGISDEIDGIPYDILPYNMKPYEGRELPNDLLAEMYNKTDEELAYEDCMESYSLCRSSQQNQYDAKICAIDKKTSSKGSFKSICELIYENCKNSDGSWGYFHDGPCAVEFVDDTAIYTTPKTTQDTNPEIIFDTIPDTTPDMNLITIPRPDEAPGTKPDTIPIPETTVKPWN